MKAVVHKYKITTPQTIINVTYTAGVLTSIEVELAEDRSEFSRIAAQLLDEPPVIREGIVKELKVNSQQQKIALWCELYKMRYGIGYKVSVREANAVKNIDLTQKLITRFFDCNQWWAKEKTITRYVNNYNELKRTESNQPESSASNNQREVGDNDSLAEALWKRYS